MREACKGSGASKAQGSGGAGKILTGVNRREETTKLTGGARVVVTEGESGRLGKA
jgi:hypothetical protein